MYKERWSTVESLKLNLHGKDKASGSVNSKQEEERTNSYQCHYNSLLQFNCSIDFIVLNCYLQELVSKVCYHNLIHAANSNSSEISLQINLLENGFIVNCRSREQTGTGLSTFEVVFLFQQTFR